MRRYLIAVLAAIVLMPGALLAQGQTTGSMTGRVVDDAGEPISGAVVALSGEALQGERTTETGENGHFTARLLPPGDYQVVVSASGFQAGVVNFSVRVGDMQPLEIALQPGEDFADEIVVTGRRTALESKETRQSFDYTTDVEELPIQNRNINVIAYNAPNTSFGPNGGQVSFAGAPGFDMVVLLDGAEISDPYFGSGTTVYLEDSIQEVEVLSSGISARYGRFQGGVVNAVTKSGGNQYSGMLRSELDKETWNSKTPFDEDQSDDLNEVYQATLGGFIMKDRLWFFAGYRDIPDTSTSRSFELQDGSVTSTTAEDRLQGKLRGAITPNHTIDVSYLEFDGTTANRAGLPPGDEFAIGNRSDPRDMTSVMYQGVLGINTFLDVNATEKNVSIKSGGDPSGGDPFLGPGTVVFNNHWWNFDDDSVRDNQTASANLTHNLDTAGFGSHLFQGGVQLVESMTAGDNDQSPTGFNLDARGTTGFAEVGPGGDIRFRMETGAATRWRSIPLRAENDVENVGVYAQDTLTWRDFRFDVGLRYDRYRGTTTGVDAFDLSFDDISPRLGVTYNISPTWQVLGTWSRYTGRFNDSWGENASGVSSAPRFVDIYSGPTLEGLDRNEVQAILRDDQFWQLATIVGSPEFPTVYLTEDAESPYSNEFMLSLRAGLPNGSGFASISYTRRDYKNLITDFTGLVCTDFNLGFDVACPGGDVSAVPGGFTDTTVWTNDGRTERDYEGLSLQVDYRPTARLSLFGNWTYSNTRGNYEGEGTNTPASGSIFGDRERAFPLESAAPYGFLEPHIQDRANLSAIYRFEIGRAGTISTGATARYRSGFTWSRTASVPRAFVPEYVSQGGSTVYTHYFDGRGQNEFESVWGLDVSARYSIPLFRRLAAFVKVGVLNVLNLDALSGRDGTTTRQGFSTTGQAVPVTNPDGSFSHWSWGPLGTCGPQDSPSKDCTFFGRIASENNYQTPRTYQLSVGFEF